MPIKRNHENPKFVVYHGDYLDPKFRVTKINERLVSILDENNELLCDSLNKGYLRYYRFNKRRKVKDIYEAINSPDEKIASARVKLAREIFKLCELPTGLIHLEDLSMYNSTLCWVVYKKGILNYRRTYRIYPDTMPFLWVLSEALDYIYEEPKQKKPREVKAKVEKKSIISKIVSFFRWKK